jgi:hypothetical protein
MHINIVQFRNTAKNTLVEAFNQHTELHNEFSRQYYFENLVMSVDFFAQLNTPFSNAVHYIVRGDDAVLQKTLAKKQKQSKFTAKIVDSIDDIQLSNRDSLYLFEDENFFPITKDLKQPLLRFTEGNSPAINVDQQYCMRNHQPICSDIHMTEFELRDFERYIGEIKDENTVTLCTDTSCSMAMVMFNQKCVMVGNNWDFHNGCHGFYQIPSFQGAQHLASLIRQECTRQNSTCELIKDKSWRYGESAQTK